MAVIAAVVAVNGGVAWAGVAVPSNHGVMLLAEQEGSHEATECLVNLVAQNAPADHRTGLWLPHDR